MDIRKTVYDKLKKLTKQNFDDSSDIYEIGIDSLDFVEVVTEVEEELNIEISDEKLEAIKTVGDVISTFEELKK